MPLSAGSLLPAGPSIPSTAQLLLWFGKPLRLLEYCRWRFGQTFTMRLGLVPPMVVVSDPTSMRTLFGATASEATAGDIAAVLKPFLGDTSVLVSDGPDHARRRKLLLPPFHGDRMHAYGADMVELTQEALARAPFGCPAPIHPTLQRITLGVIVRTVFGTRSSARATRVAEVIAELLEQAASPWMLLPVAQRDLGRWSPWGKFRRHAAAAEAMIVEEIRDRRARLSDETQDVLSLLLKARDESGEPLSDDELRDQMVTLLVAGHETTATALAWTLDLLTRHPGAMQTLLEALEGLGPAPSPARIAALPYLDAVIRESLRLRPVVPMIGRTFRDAVRIDGYDLPAGQTVMGSIYLAQRRAEVFPDPDAFRPERFLGGLPTPFEWFPFGGGIRKCLGMAFALYEMKMVLAALLCEVSVEAALRRPTRVVRRSITLAPAEGLPLVLTRRVQPRRASP